jgi:hypothetical protein
VAHLSLCLILIVSRITHYFTQGAVVPTVVPQRDRSRWLQLATLPFVLGAMMGCVHSLVAAIFLIVLQLVPHAVRLTRLHPS